jgi:hypothetical protein
VSGIGNRPPERYEVCRDNRAGRNPRYGWYVLDNLTGRCIRFFASQANAYSLLHKIQENPRVAARSLEPEAPTADTPDEERARRVRWQVSA